MPRTNVFSVADVLNKVIDPSLDALDVVLSTSAATGVPAVDLASSYGTLGYLMLASMALQLENDRSIRLILEQMLALMASENDTDAKRLDEALAQNV